MATVKLLLEKNRESRKGSFPLIFRVIHERRKRVISTPYKILLKEYDIEKECVVYLSEKYRSAKEVKSINRAIKRQRRSINTHILELESIGENYNIEQIMSRYYVEHEHLGLLGFIDRLVQRKREIGKIGTAIAYQNTRRSLSRFLDNKCILVSMINAMLVKNYENHLIKRGVKPNTVSYYMRNFKSVYTQALYEGIDAPALSPFRGIRFSSQKTVKRALDSDTICSIKNISFSGCDRRFVLARDLFMFSFLTRGMPFVDMFYLKKKNITNDVIEYYRCKTGQRLKVALTDESKAIINRYDRGGEYIFPMLNDNKEYGEDVRKVYKLTLEKVNRHLRRIGKILELNLPLTTYVARHCWATQAKEVGVPISVISESLGHSSEMITRIYLKEFDNSVLDDANRRVIDALFATENQVL